MTSACPACNEIGDEKLLSVCNGVATIVGKCPHDHAWAHLYPTEDVVEINYDALMRDALRMQQGLKDVVAALKGSDVAQWVTGRSALDAAESALRSLEVMKL